MGPATDLRPGHERSNRRNEEQWNRVKYFWRGQWLENEDGAFWIIPARAVEEPKTDRTIPRVVGPDDQLVPGTRRNTAKNIRHILLAKTRAGEHCDRLTDDEMEALGLREIPSSRKQYNPIDGYTVA